MRYQRKSAKIIINWHNFGHKTEIDIDNYLILLRNMVEAAGVESEADLTTTGVYKDLPNVYRMKDILMLVIKSSFQYFFLP